MKKKVLILLISLLIPLNVYAYSNQIMLGGNSLGIEVKSDGIMVIGFYKVSGKYNQGSLKVGDYITKVEDDYINSIKDLTTYIENHVDDKRINITYKRKDKEYQTTLNLVYEDGIYKTGLYVKDGITGIGTLTYVDPETKIYGALGHEIIESNSSNIVEIKTGSIFKNVITSIDKSTMGNPGSKNAKFYHNTKYGTIDKNTIYGIYGRYNANVNNELIEVANKDEVQLGSAKIYTVLNGEEVESYDINIKSINESSNVKNLVFEITDKRLIELTGGIVQGMSGSPIVQNNKIIGAVTHVIVDNPLSGYGIFINTMLEEGEKQ